jgi:hypothetical protein
MTLHDTTESHEDLAARLHDLATARTAGSQPWPRVSHSIRRARRRRRLPVAAALVVALATGLGAATGVLEPSGGGQIHAAAQTASQGSDQPPVLRRAGLIGEIGGSLGDDEAWIDGLRERIATLAQEEHQQTSPQGVLVLWAGDLAGRRYAVVMNHYDATVDAGWSLTPLVGRIGATPDAMIPRKNAIAGLDDTAMGQPAVMIIGDQDEAPEQGVAFVIAPRADEVSVASGRTVSPTGVITSRWRPLEKDGAAVWTTALDRDELALFSVRVDGEEQPNGGGVGGPRFDELTTARQIAAPGTAGSELREARQALDPIRPLPSEVPVIAGTSVHDDLTATGLVLRTPDNGYLVGIHAKASPSASQSGSRQLGYLVSRQPFASPDRFMAAAQLTGLIQPGRQGEQPSNLYIPVYVAVVPQGATSIRIGTLVAPAENRVAVVRAAPSDIAGGYPDSVRVEALDADGRVIAAVTSQPVEYPVYAG